MALLSFSVVMVMKATQSYKNFYIRQMFSPPVKYNVNKWKLIYPKKWIKVKFCLSFLRTFKLFHINRFILLFLLCWMNRKAIATDEWRPRLYAVFRFLNAWNEMKWKCILTFATKVKIFTELQQREQKTVPFILHAYLFWFKMNKND